MTRSTRTSNTTETTSPSNTGMIKAGVTGLSLSAVIPSTFFGTCASALLTPGMTQAAGGYLSVVSGAGLGLGLGFAPTVGFSMLAAYCDSWTYKIAAATLAAASFALNLAAGAWLCGSSFSTLMPLIGLGAAVAATAAVATLLTTATTVTAAGLLAAGTAKTFVPDLPQRISEVYSEISNEFSSFRP